MSASSGKAAPPASRVVLSLQRSREEFPVRMFLRGAVVIAAATLLLSCGGNEDNAPQGVPTGFTVQPGDTSVVVTWDQKPGLTYWVFSAAAPSITRDNYRDFPSARITQPATSPQLITGLTNGTTYSFLINATENGSAAGPATTSIAAVPRLAGGSWTLGAALPGDINAISLATGGYVAVGAGGLLYTRESKIGAAWVAGTSGVTTALNAAAALGVTIAVGDGGVILTSTDAKTWTARTSGTTARLNGVVAGLATFLAVGDNGTILRSTDAVTWNPVNSGTTADLYSVAIVNNTLVAVGAGGTLLSSSDVGLTWTVRTTGVTANLRSVAYSNRYVAVGDAGTVITSTDLASWTAQTPPTPRTLRRVVYSTRLVAAGDGGTVLVSDDGSTWTAATTGTTADLRALVAGSQLDYLFGGAGGVNGISR
jgi:hypothetical protein